jgi:anti-sigma B factor antagonist
VLKVSLKITTREVGDVTVIDLKGKVTIGAGDVELRNTVTDLLDAGKKKLVLNMENLKYMDSSGVGELVSTFTTVSNREGQLKLSNLSSKIFDLLQITQLLQVFDVHQTADEAVADFD